MTAVNIAKILWKLATVHPGRKLGVPVGTNLKSLLCLHSSDTKSFEAHIISFERKREAPTHRGVTHTYSFNSY